MTTYSLPNPRQPLGLPLAEITIQQHTDGLWRASASVMLRETGIGRPRQHSKAHGSEDAAMQDAAGVIRLFCSRVLNGQHHSDHCRLEAQSVLDWLQGLNQPTLFEAQS